MINEKLVHPKSTRILIVEDERIVAMDLSQSLQSLGYEVAGIASNGEMAIRLAEREQPDLILMDIKIKGDIDGIETASRIQSIINAPLLYLTAFADDDTINRAKHTEPHGYILKPFEKKNLHTTIEMSLYKYNMEKRIKTSERWLNATLNSMGEAMIAADPAGNINMMNPIAEQITGCSLGESTNKKLDDVLKLVDARGRPVFTDIAGMINLEKKSIEISGDIWLVNKLNEKKPVFGTAASIIDDKHNLTGIVIVFHDITKLKKIENELRSSEERFLKAFHASPHTIFISRYSDGRLIEANDGWEQLIGCTREVSIENETKLVDYISNKKDAQDIFEIFNNEGFVRDYETSIKRTNGEIRQVNFGLEKIELNGETHLLGILKDITDKKRAEKEKEILFKQVSSAQERLKILSRRLLEIQELERRNLARELHDEIGQILTAIKINLQMTNRFIDSPEIEPHIKESIDLVEEALKQVRNLSLDLRPSMLDDLGLVPALRWYVDRQSQRTGIHARLIAEPIKKRLNPHLEVTCYRIAQEALTNVIRHAGADANVKVELGILNNELNLKITDNGKGFDVYAALQRALSGNSLGILGMQERVELVGGTLKITSKPGKGTEIHAVFPFDHIIV